MGFNSAPWAPFELFSMMREVLQKQQKKIEI